MLDDFPFNGDPLASQILQTTLHAAGADDVLGLYGRIGPLSGSADGPLWIASTVGLVLVFVSGDRATYHLDSDGQPLADAATRRQIRLQVEVCPWADVINPEMSIDVINLTDGSLALTVDFKVQLPRITLHATGSTEDDSDAIRLARFGGVVLAQRRS